MTKYTDDLELSVIHHYLNGYGYEQTAKVFGMDDKQVELWVKLYQAHGIDGIRTRTSKTVYSSEFKHHAVLQILAGKSIRQLAIELNISNPALLSSWLKAYQNHGTWDLTPNPKAKTPCIKPIKHALVLNLMIKRSKLN
ncbi:helix-turn-helix domain containing protein [Moraxella nasibovis]|uniref:helix-turn-helix domain-containing protein n=1 Tax=Moraxella nasibovis TaxID=2904120 RepID=UPI00240F3A3F|nr:helix-turn-helix domain-containing protein [Moraxella nasibovis]WFF38402.1 helix-turn-helix domain containing protein [Moraxella nasibovis]